MGFSVRLGQVQYFIEKSASKAEYWSVLEYLFCLTWAPQGCTSVALREGSFRLGERESLWAAVMYFACQKRDNLIQDFLGILKCYFFISRWFSLLGGAAASLTNAWACHTSAGGFVLLTLSCSVITKRASGNWQCWALHEMHSAPSRTEP